MKSILICALLLTSCAAITPAEEATFIQRGNCTFGGISERTEFYCAQKNFGTARFLADLNTIVLYDKPAGWPCTEHVAAVANLLNANRPDLKTHPVYSLMNKAAGGKLHTSLMVIDADGAEYVVDNGAAFDPIENPGFVGTWEQYKNSSRVTVAWKPVKMGIN